MQRVRSIDVVRGIVMVIMALDHVRDLMHVSSITESPTNLETTSPVLFFTRWITHLCAPTFVFLAGTSAYFSFTTTANPPLTRSFLLKRGFYLIALEFIVVNLLLFFDPGYHTVLFEVIAAIGFGFIVLGLLLHISATAPGIIGIAILALHNLLPLISFPDNSLVKTILSPLFSPGAFPLPTGRIFIMAYPPLPWLGILLTGFAAGKLFIRAPGKRARLFIQIGLGAVFLFVFLRCLNVCGDPVPWSSQKSFVYSFLSFINVDKYPPSLQFCLVTLGIMFLLLAMAERRAGPFFRVVSVYGKVPLFYFLANFLVIHVVMVALMFAQGFSWSQLPFASGTFGRPKDVVSGVGLPAINFIWLLVVGALYYPCRWFGRYKSGHRQWWLRYI